jgi:hypothetical protein
MQNRFGVIGLAAALLAVTSMIGYAQTIVDPGTVGSTTPRQPGPWSSTTSEGGPTVFRGAPGAAASASEIPVSGGPDGSPQASPAGPGGITVFRGAPGGTSSRSGLLGASPPTAPPAPGLAAGR